jgi:hypothetical protein
MKVQELLAEESLRDYLIRLVDKEGITKLGGGAFSQVFQHPQFHNVVTKVYTAKDRKYATYATWCQANQSNPYVPQIIEQLPFTHGKQKYIILFMEKMTPLKNEAQLFRAWVRALKLPKDGPHNEEILEHFSNYVEDSDSGELAKGVKLAFELGYGDANLVKIWNHILTYGVKNIDLHEGNMMLRGRQLVFTDPVAGHPDYKNWIGKISSKAEED